jgi:hypothetical protein
MLGEAVVGCSGVGVGWLDNMGVQLAAGGHCSSLRCTAENCRWLGAGRRDATVRCATMARQFCGGAGAPCRPAPGHVVAVLLHPPAAMAEVHPCDGPAEHGHTHAACIRQNGQVHACGAQRCAQLVDHNPCSWPMLNMIVLVLGAEHLFAEEMNVRQ